MWITRCVYGHCDSNTKDVDKPRMRGVFFIGFPERNKELSRCENWVKACGRNDLTLDDIDDKTLICNLHFVGCCGPSYQYPDPIPYVPTSKETSGANRRPQDNLVRPQQIIFPTISETISENNQQSLKSEHRGATLDSSFKTCSNVALQPNDREVSEYWYYSPSLEHNYNLPADSEPSRKRLASRLKYNQSLVKHPKLNNNGIYVEQIVIPRRSHVPVDETKHSYNTQTHDINKPNRIGTRSLDTTSRTLNKPVARNEPRTTGSSGSVVETNLGSNTHTTTRKKIKRKKKGKSKLFYKKKTSVGRKLAGDNLRTHPAPITFVNVRPQTQYVTDEDHAARARGELARFRSYGRLDVVKKEFQDDFAAELTSFQTHCSTETSGKCQGSNLGS
uniref:THAP-type domain-containing protein n=1 Tax=Timema poppense TaxID=170557 RepID=A0A7R9CY32_TIMPO|nr:unnamed protein product [Timema poppensis]